MQNIQDGPPLDDEAVTALTTARAAASARPSGTMTWADLLLALLEPGTMASRVVEFMGPDAAHLRTGAEFFAANLGDVPVPDIEAPTVARAQAEALTLGHAAIATDHLLLGLAQPSSGMVGAMLASAGLSPDIGRDAVRAARGELPGWQPPEPGYHVEGGLELVGGMTGSYKVLADETDVELSPEDLAIRKEMLERIAFAEVGCDALQRVIGIGQLREDAGVTVELIALEIRGLGSRLHWRARSQRPWMAGDLGLVITDDLGTRYQTSSGQSSSGSGLGGSHAEGEATIMPSPSAETRSMTIEVTGFGAHRQLPVSMGWPPEVAVEGSWRFQVDLG